MPCDGHWKNVPCKHTHEYSTHTHILQMNRSNHMCLSLSALHEFPTDLFTHKERTEGAVALHVLCVSLPCPTLLCILVHGVCVCVHVRANANFCYLLGTSSSINTRGRLIQIPVISYHGGR